MPLFEYPLVCLKYTQAGAYPRPKRWVLHCVHYWEVEFQSLGDWARVVQFVVKLGVKPRFPNGKPWCHIYNSAKLKPRLTFCLIRAIHSRQHPSRWRAPFLFNTIYWGGSLVHLQSLYPGSRTPWDWRLDLVLVLNCVTVNLDRLNETAETRAEANSWLMAFHPHLYPHPQLLTLPGGICS